MTESLTPAGTSTRGFVRPATSCSRTATTTTPPTATSLAGAGELQLGARLVRRRSPRGNAAPGAADRRGGRQRARAARSPSCRARSDHVASWLRDRGVAPGDRLLLMLGNQVELWETMLAAMKLGAVVIPATTLLGPADLRDRFERGGARHVVVRAGRHRASSTTSPATTRAIAVGEPVDGLAALRRRRRRAGRVRARRPDHGADDPLLLYFTSGTTAQPKLVEHTHPCYPVGHLSTMYWIGLQPGDVHLNISSPGLGQARLEQRLRAVERRGHRAVVQLRALRRRRRCWTRSSRCGVTTFCAPPTVWRMLIQADLGRWHGAAARGGRRRRAAQPGGHRAGAAAWGITIRDGYGQTETTAQVGNPPGQPLKPGSMGRPLPGYRVALLDPVSGEPADEGEICLDLAPRPLGLMAGYRDDPERTAEAMRGGFYHTGDVAAARRRRLHHLRRPRRRRVQGSDYRISPSSWRACCGAPGGRRGGGRARRPTRCGWPCPRPTWCSPPAASRAARPRSRSSLRPRAPGAVQAGAPAGVRASCPRRSPARSAGSSCATSEDERPARRAEGDARGHEFWEEDFPELKR